LPVCNPFEDYSPIIRTNPRNWNIRPAGAGWYSVSRLKRRGDTIIKYSTITDIQMANLMGRVMPVYSLSIDLVLFDTLCSFPSGHKDTKAQAPEDDGGRLEQDQDCGIFPHEYDG
jgi:hypothetical protein